jgi:hypothetical protein
MKAGMSEGRLIKRHGSIDASAIGATPLDVTPKFVEVTASNTYRVYESATKYRSKYMYKGIEYEGDGIAFITDAAGTALTAGICYYVY